MAATSHSMASTGHAITRSPPGITVKTAETGVPANISVKESHSQTPVQESGRPRMKPVAQRMAPMPARAIAVVPTTRQPIPSCWPGGWSIKLRRASGLGDFHRLDHAVFDRLFTRPGLSGDGVDCIQPVGDVAEDRI